MDSEHDVFIQGIEQERKLEVTFFCKKQQREVVSLCVPLHYSKGLPASYINVENELGCYYLWYFGVKKGNHFLSLSPSEIIRMELTDEVFCAQEFFSLSKQE